MAKPKKPAAPAAPTPTETPTPEVVVSTLPPPPPESVVEPTPPPAPAEVVLVHQGGKRYQSKTDPDSNYHLRERSLASKPVGIVRNICNANPDLTRKAIIDLCLAAGVNKNTAATQYSLWKAKARNAPANQVPGLVAVNEDGTEVPHNTDDEVVAEGEE